jgi:hypothetical protein
MYKNKLIELSVKYNKNTKLEPWLWSYIGWDLKNLQKNTLAFKGG